MRALLLALTLAACSTSPREELPPPQLPQRAGYDQTVALRAEGVNYYAHGAGFTLRMFDDRIVFSTPGAADKVFTRPEPQHPVWNGEIYTTSNEQHRLYLTLRFDRPCPTGNGEDLVELRLDGIEFAGCGRRL